MIIYFNSGTSFEYQRIIGREKKKIDNNETVDILKIQRKQFVKERKSVFFQ